MARVDGHGQDERTSYSLFSCSLESGNYTFGVWRLDYGWTGVGRAIIYLFFKLQWYTMPHAGIALPHLVLWFGGVNAQNGHRLRHTCQNNHHSILVQILTHNFFFSFHLFSPRTLWHPLFTLHWFDVAPVIQCSPPHLHGAKNWQNIAFSSARWRMKGEEVSASGRPVIPWEGWWRAIA